MSGESDPTESDSKRNASNLNENENLLNSNSQVIIRPSTTPKYEGKNKVVDIFVPSLEFEMSGHKIWKCISEDEKVIVPQFKIYLPSFRKRSSLSNIYVELIAHEIEATES